MRVLSLNLRDFRSYASTSVALGERITVISGPNGSGKSNLLEAVYFGCTGRSCRTSSDREVIRFGQPGARVEVRTEGADGRHEIAVAFFTGEAKRMTVDGSPVERLLDVPARPLVSVFLPDRLELIKGVPAIRRAHVDHLVTALWPSRAVNRRAYAQVLAQRNALLARIRTGSAPASLLDMWDHQLATRGLALMHDRAEAVGALAPGYERSGSRLGLDGELALRYRPRVAATDAGAFVEQLRERRDGDIDRGFTGYGPHRDDLAFTRDGRELRTYASQGQQRVALLALLLAERDVITQWREAPPLMLLDDVMSELDPARRRALVAALEESDGQALITTTELDHVPLGSSRGVRTVDIAAPAGHRLAVAG